MLSTMRQERYLLAVDVLKDAGVPFFAEARGPGGLSVSPGLVHGSAKRRSGGTYDVEVPILHAERARALLSEHRLDLPEEDATDAPEDVRFNRALLGALVVATVLFIAFLLLTSGRSS